MAAVGVVEVVKKLVMAIVVGFKAEVPERPSCNPLGIRVFLTGFFEGLHDG